MKTLVVQIQTGKVPLDEDEAVKKLELLLKRNSMGGKVSQTIDLSEGWVNLEIEVLDTASAWKSIKADMEMDSIATDLSSRWIVTCEGERGWDDYKLIAHYDPASRIDE